MKRLIKQIMGLVLAGAMMVSLSACGDSSPLQQSYRSIKVYQTKGQAVIEREKVGKMDAIENLKLLSGDLGEVFVASNMRLQLDEDKFILIEEQSRLSIEAEGDEDTSKTRIKLLEGAITCEIENKLSKNSFFEISTPNSIMAVRGTTFRVAYGSDGGSGETIVQTFGGTVTVTPTDKKGTPTQNSRDITGGEQATVVNVNQSAESTDASSNENVVGQFKTEENEVLNLINTSFDTISFLLNEDYHRTYRDPSVGNAGQKTTVTTSDGMMSSYDGSIPNQKQNTDTVGDTVFSVEELLNAKEEIPQEVSQKLEEQQTEQEDFKQKLAQSSKNTYKQNQPTPIEQPVPSHADDLEQPAKPQPTKPVSPGTPSDISDSGESGQGELDRENKDDTDDSDDNKDEDDHSGDTTGEGDDSDDDNDKDDHSGDTTGKGGDSDDDKGEDDHSGDTTGKGDDSGDDTGDDDQGTGEKPKPVLYTLTCMSGNTKLSVKEMPEKTLITEPSHPDESNAGHWALEPSGSPVSFVDFQIHSNITLYWVEESPEQYTVVFQHGETTFCTQTISEGEMAHTPYLQPTQNGYWQKKGEHSAFDFASSKILSDTTLHWIAEAINP